jgi:hypothetical protein
MYVSIRVISRLLETHRLCIGIEHDRNSGFHLSKRQILVQFLAKHLPWAYTSLGIDGEHARILVYPTVF